jgi:hypothetical protein
LINIALLCPAECRTGVRIGFEVLTAMRSLIALMMEAARTSETLVNFY